MSKRTRARQLRPLEHRLEVTDRKIESAEAKLRKLLATKEALKAKHLSIRNAQDAIFGAPSKKNMRIRLSWDAVKRRLNEPDAAVGLSSADLFRAVSDEMIRLKPSTFRGHLARFSEEKLIRSVGGYWRLSADVNT